MLSRYARLNIGGLWFSNYERTRSRRLHEETYHASYGIRRLLDERGLVVLSLSWIHSVSTPEPSNNTYREHSHLRTLG